MIPVPGELVVVLGETAAERARQDAKWGENRWGQP